MKMEKKLKFTLYLLCIIFICVIGFGGLYIQKNGLYKNIIPDFERGSKLNGSRITTFKLDDSTKETIYDADGNIVESIPEGESEENYTKKEIPINNDEIKNVDNYKKSKEIMINRLKSLGMSNYEVRLNENNGDISIELNENKKTDDTLAQMNVIGKFEVIDTDTKEVLMNTEDLDNAKIFYNNTSSGIVVYLNINFTKEGTEKFKEITKNYTKIETKDTEDEDASTDEEKTITINIDGEKFLSTSFNGVIENGELTVSIGNASTDTSTISDYVTSAQYYSTILSNGELPLTYKLQSSEYIESVYANKTYIYITLGVLATILFVAIIYMIIRYKTFGLWVGIIDVASIAVIGILLRITKIEINIETIVSGVIVLFLIIYSNLAIIRNLRKEDKFDERKIKINNSLKRVMNVIIVALIPAIVLTYNSLLKVSNIGMTLFWGIIIVTLMNLIFTRSIFLLNAKK